MLGSSPGKLCTLAYIQQSSASERSHARELGVTVDTIRRWRKRTEVQDASPTPHRLQTTLTPVQEAVCLKEHPASTETALGTPRFENR